jgi:hypothetical protein
MCTEFFCDLDDEPEATCTPEHIWEQRQHRVAQFIDETFYLGSVPTEDQIWDSVWNSLYTVTVPAVPTDEMLDYGLEKSKGLFAEIAAEYATS